MSLLQFNSKDLVDSDYWRELRTPYDYITELANSDIDLNNRLTSLLNKLSKPNLEEVCKMYQIDSSETINKTNTISKFNVLSKNQKKEILLFIEFSSRKKKAIEKVFDFKKNELLNHPISKLKSLFEENPIHLIEILTYYLWNERGSGEKYELKNISFSDVKKLINEYTEKFTKILGEKSLDKSYFKIHSYSILKENELILHIYKQVNDSPKPDFDKAIRNKEVVSLFIKFDFKTKLIEIKGANKNEKKCIIEAVESIFNKSFFRIKSELFKTYNPSKIEKAFTEGDYIDSNINENFLVSKISFKNSTLIRSPKLTFQLENETIWPSIKDAKEKGIVKMKSIKDIEFLVAKCGAHEKKVRSTLLNNGNIIFTFDDSRMDDLEKEIFCEQFKCSFGVPLFQEILNSHFQEGQIDKVDYVMSLSSTNALSNDEKIQIELLLENKIMSKKTLYTCICKNCGKINESQDYFENELELECSCGSDDYNKKSNDIIENDFKQILKIVKQKLNSQFESKGFSYKGSSKIKINDVEFKGISLLNETSNELLQVIITDKTLHPKFLNRLSTMMIPTIIVTVGIAENLLINMRKQGIIPLNFGRVYLSKDTDLEIIFKDIFKIISIESKSMITNAADNAYQSLKNIICLPSEAPKDYDDKIFEDDVYAILKEIVPNSQKWGKEKSGQAYPEGLFAVSTKNTNNEKITRVYSYDCKFTRQDEGYDLGRSENRKAHEYAKNLNDNAYITRFSDTQSLSAHIFITNAAKESQMEKMRDYFYKNLSKKNDTICIFIDVSSLLFLFENYRNNFEHLQANRNLFYEQLVGLLSREHIKEETVSKYFNKALDDDLKENAILNMKKVSDEYSEML